MRSSPSRRAVFQRQYVANVAQGIISRWEETLRRGEVIESGSLYDWYVGLASVLHFQIKVSSSFITDLSRLFATPYVSLREESENNICSTPFFL